MTATLNWPEGGGGGLICDETVTRPIRGPGYPDFQDCDPKTTSWPESIWIGEKKWDSHPSSLPPLLPTRPHSSLISRYANTSTRRLTHRSIINSVCLCCSSSRSAVRTDRTYKKIPLGYNIKTPKYFFSIVACKRRQCFLNKRKINRSSVLLLHNTTCHSFQHS